MSHEYGSASGVCTTAGRAQAVAVVACLALALALAGCQGGRSLGLSKYLKGDQPEVADARVIEPGQWREDHLHCAESRCDNFYWIDVGESGRLRVEVYAPWGGDLPDFGVVLLDPVGKPVAVPESMTARPQRLELDVDPGRYTVRVHSAGQDDARIDYELIASLEAGSQRRKPAARSAARPPADGARPMAPPAPGPTPPSAAAPDGAPLMQAEVLDVEREDGEPAFLLLDAGRGEEVTVGMKGRLREGDAEIGRFEIVEVYRDGSRARLVGAPSAEITIDTVAEIVEAPAR